MSHEAKYSGSKGPQVQVATPQVFNQNVVASFSAGVQRLDVQINVPFPVRRMVFHAPRHNLAFGAAAADQYLLYSSLNKGAGIVGMIDSAITGPQSQAITVTFDQPTMIGGQYQFWVRRFIEIAGGAAADLTARVWQHIEFHSE